MSAYFEFVHYQKKHRSDPNILNSIPLVSQLKSTFQYWCGDVEGAWKTADDFMTLTVGLSQLRSLYEWGALRNPYESRETQRIFVQSYLRVLNMLTSATPLVGHLKAFCLYLISRNDEAFDAVLLASRSAFVLLSAVGTSLTFGGLSLAVPFAMGITSAFGFDLLASEYLGRSYGLLSSAYNLVEDDVGAHFDFFVQVILAGVKGWSACFTVTQLLKAEMIVSSKVVTAPLTLNHLTNPELAPFLLNGRIPLNAQHAGIVVQTESGHSYYFEKDGNAGITEYSNSPAWKATFLEGKAPTYTPFVAYPDIAQREAFAEKLIPSPTVTLRQVEHQAQALSARPYDLLHDNCQHFARDLYDYTGGETKLEFLPNEALLKAGEKLSTEGSPLLTWLFPANPSRARGVEEEGAKVDDGLLTTEQIQAYQQDLEQKADLSQRMDFQPGDLSQHQKFEHFLFHFPLDTLKTALPFLMVSELGNPLKTSSEPFIER